MGVLQYTFQGDSLMSSVRVSIVIPTYKRVVELRLALKKILAQTFEDYEVLIVDNHSDDGTDEMIADLQDPRLTLVKVHNEGIIARSRNVGIKAARGDYIAFLDSDDWWCPDKLERCVALLDQGADVTYHDLQISRGPETALSGKRVKTWPLTGDPFQAFLSGGNALANSGVMLRRSILGGITQSEHPALVGMEDFDLWLRLAKAGARFVRTNGALGFYRVGEDNFTNPERSLRALGTLMQRHHEISFEQAGWWLPYGRGRARYLTGDKPGARQDLRRIFKRRAPMAIYAKTAAMLMR